MAERAVIRLDSESERNLSDSFDVAAMTVEALRRLRECVPALDYDRTAQMEKYAADAGGAAWQLRVACVHHLLECINRTVERGKVEQAKQQLAADCGVKVSRLREWDDNYDLLVRAEASPIDWRSLASDITFWDIARQARPDDLEALQLFAQRKAESADYDTKAARRDVHALKKRAQDERRAELVADAVDAVNEDGLPSTLKLVHADFDAALAVLEPESVDLILTDPPYHAEHLALWSSVAEHAARALKPGGLFIAYSGQYLLDRVFAAVGEHLTYHWCLVALHTHGQLRFWGRHAWNSWKPIVVWSNGAPQHEWFVDVLRQDAEEERLSESEETGIDMDMDLDALERLADKATDSPYVDPTVLDMGDAATKLAHEWGQPLAHARYLVKHFCPIGGLVVDPMSGGGTVPLAATLEGCRAIGIEIDEARYLAGKGRILAALEALHG